MKKTTRRGIFALIVVSLIVGVVFTSGCTQQMPGGTPSSSGGGGYQPPAATTAQPATKDCGSNLACFQDALSTCTPATVSAQYMGKDMYTEIKGGSSSSCTVAYTFSGIGQLVCTETLATFLSGTKDVGGSLDLCKCSGSAVAALRAEGSCP